MPARVLLQDFTGVPCVVDLAAMRDAMQRMGGDPTRINPLQPVDLVIDHSVQVDAFGTPQAFGQNVELEYERNRERYAFLRWGQRAFQRLPRRAARHRHRAPGEPRVPRAGRRAAGARTARRWSFPDTVVGTDSHTTMINGLGVVGWGVGGIEAEAAMLGQPTVMLIPQVVGFRLHGALRDRRDRDRPRADRHADAAQEGRGREVRRVLRAGLASLSLADRATIANMAPEYGATIGFFPIDDETLAYLRLTGRDADARRAGRSVLRRRRASSATADTPDAGVQRHARARPGDGRAEPRRAEAPAGSRAAAHREGVVAGGARRLREGQARRPRRPRCRSR